jgi:hypothetical protein
MRSLSGGPAAAHAPTLTVGAMLIEPNLPPIKP